MPRTPSAMHSSLAAPEPWQDSVRWMAPTGLAIAVGWSVILFLGGYGWFLSGTLIVLTALAASLRLYPANRSPRARVVGYVRSGAFVVCIALMSLSVGGFNGGITPWLTAFPFLAFLYANRTSARVSTMTAIVSCAVMAAYILIFEPQEVVRTRVDVVLRALGTASATAFTYVGAMRVERLRDRVMERQRASRDALKQELEAHQRTQYELQRTTEQMTVAARQAGMAEIAAGVLHNVGNALNSAKVSAHMVQGARDDVSERLRRLSERVAAGDVPSDKLATYLIQLADRNEAMTGKVRSEADVLAERLDHIDRVIQAQQAHAHSKGLVEPLDLATTVEQALAITGRPDFITYDVQVPRHPEVLGEPHKALQVVTNLLANARDAITQAGDARGAVLVRGGHDDERVWLEVTDSGIGLESEDLARVFEYGFTKKVSGHGFGLHASALCAAELGGRLTVHSEGLGRGAVFRLEIDREVGDVAAAG